MATTSLGYRGLDSDLRTMPATSPSAPEIRIASDAMDVLGCYVNEFDQIVYGLAKKNAAARQSQPTASGGVIVVEIEDVKSAAETFTSAVQAHLGAAPEHAQLVAAIEDMHQCLKSRCEAAAKRR